MTFGSLLPGKCDVVSRALPTVSAKVMVVEELGLETDARVQDSCGCNEAVVDEEGKDKCVTISHSNSDKIESSLSLLVNQGCPQKTKSLEKCHLDRSALCRLATIYLCIHVANTLAPVIHRSGKHGSLIDQCIQIHFNP